MNIDLLKPFSLEAAQRGEEICWYDDGEPVTFLAEAGPNGENALRDADGNVLCSRGIHLRMNPLAWCEKKPVYKGDVLYSKYGGGSWTIDSADDLASNNVVRFKEGGYAYLKDCTCTKPEPVKKTRTVMFLGYRTQNGALILVDGSEPVWLQYKRVPSADVTYEVEE